MSCVLGTPALSIRSRLYQPARAEPIWIIHFQTSAAGAPIVTRACGHEMRLEDDVITGKGHFHFRFGRAPGKNPMSQKPDISDDGDKGEQE